MRVVVRLFSVRSQQSVFSREYTGPASNPRFFAHTISDEIHQNQRALRGVARTRSDVLVRPRPGACHQHRREPAGQGDLHQRLRRRQSAARHGESDVEHHTDLVARRTIDCVHLVPPRVPRRLRVADLRGHAADSNRRQGTELAAGLVARRHADRVHVESRRQCRAVRDEPGWVERPPGHEQSGHRHDADVVADRHSRSRSRPIDREGRRCT